ncbi:MULTISPECIES: hypothetical protein [Bradyrhizobium]|nr:MULTISPECIES: hypothetical protein [Bradyrhizobium]MDE5457599.1 hypothetical protein [Bradyrhizobium sp. CSA112]WOH52645.1 hypothetical protein RX328_11185 [Bradyrhizobium sp. sBnM-33]
MAGHFYRLRMGIYAETLFRRSNRVKRERIWLQYNVMRLGSELRRSEHWSSAAGQPGRHRNDAAETVATLT